MLSSGCRESVRNVVDLSNDPSVGRGELEVLLRFILSDVFTPLNESSDHAFRVWTLADRYQLPLLRSHVEACFDRRRRTQRNEEM